MTDRMRIPEGEVHRVQVAFREDIAICTLNRFCSEFETELEYDEDFGIICTFSATDEMMEYFEDIYGCYATQYECDIDQKVDGKPSEWRAAVSETRLLPVTRHGNSLTLNITQMCKAIDVGYGDIVRVTLEPEERIDMSKEQWGIFDKDGNLDCDPEPMLFDTRKEAMEVLGSDAYESGSGYYVDRVS